MSITVNGHDYVPSSVKVVGISAPQPMRAGATPCLLRKGTKLMKMKFATLAVASAFVFASGTAFAHHSPEHGKGQLAFEVPYDPAAPVEAPKAKAPGATGQVHHRSNCWNYY